MLDMIPVCRTENKRAKHNLSCLIYVGTNVASQGLFSKCSVRTLAAIDETLEVCDCARTAVTNSPREAHYLVAIGVLCCFVDKNCWKQQKQVYRLR